ncbi:MAG: cation diffusion facilitator family transporter [Anaerolineaceae bacterium]|nr:cation diffusion facilitator family transporter [Anaerolineaceae bacterium]
MQNPRPHTHDTPHTLWGWIGAIFHIGGHSHSHDDHSIIEADPASTNQEAIRTVWLAILALGITTVIQIVIVALSGSVALLADTIHNVGDTLNSIPLLLAFYMARKAATRRYTYGFGRAEDVAGILIVLSIVVSAAVVFWESIQKLLNPQPMQNIGWVAAAAIVGFLGNEAVALLQIRTGRKIGSDAMIADGLHARIDGLTSLAVLVAAVGTALGFPILDPLIGLLIGVAILFITKDATVRIWYRLMDAVDPTLVDQIEHHASQVTGVERVQKVRVHWVGHQLFAELTLTSAAQLSVEESNTITTQVIARLQEIIPHLAEITVQINAGSQTANPQSAAILNMLPPRYQLVTPSAAPMGAAGLIYGNDGKVAWDEIWQGFCDLALAGGPPHRGTLLEPVNPSEIAANPDAYERVLQELERGIQMVTGLPTVRSTTAGWVGMECSSEAMALWLLRAIVVENISVRREGKTLYFPAGANFQLEKEIKNVVTVIAKTNHYWQEHAQSLGSK